MKKGALLESLETVLVVSVITALIWLYAEAETTRTDSRPIKIRFVEPTADLAVSILDPDTNVPGETEMNVTAVIQATRGDWPRIDDWLSDSDNTTEIRVHVPQADSEDQVFNLRDALSDSPLVRQNAFIKETDPATLTVRVQKLQKVEMPVSIDQGQLEMSEESPIPDPAKVPVEMPAELAAQVREQNLKLTARLDQLDVEELEEDTQITEFVALELPPLLQNQPHVSLAQENVQVTFIVRKITEEYELPNTVQVRLRISDEITGKYRIQIDDSSRFLRVTVRGPTEAIRRIKENPSLVRASIQLKLEHLASGGSNTALLEFDLPSGVKVIETKPPITTIGYTAAPLNEQP